jgi:hypothetical protein
MPKRIVSARRNSLTKRQSHSAGGPVSRSAPRPLDRSFIHLDNEIAEHLSVRDLLLLGTHSPSKRIL